MTHSSSQSRRAAVDGAGSGRVQTHKRGLQLSQRGTGRDTGVHTKMTKATLKIYEVELYSAFQTLNVIQKNFLRHLTSYLIRSMPYHDWHLVKGLVSGSPLFSAVVKINILGVRLKVGHATHGISLFSLYIHAESEDISDATHEEHPSPFCVHICK